MRWNNYREDEVGSGCLSLVCGILSAGMLLLWVTGLFDFNLLFTDKAIWIPSKLRWLPFFFPIGGIATGIYALQTEERPFAIAGIFLSAVLLLLFVLAFVRSVMFF